MVAVADEQTKLRIARFYDASPDSYLSELDADDAVGRNARATLSRIVDLITRFYSNSQKPCLNSVVLDGGCGNGRWSALYLNVGFTVLGVDLSPGMLKSAIRRLVAQRTVEGFHAVRADLSHLPLRAGSVDLVHLYGVIEHLRAEDLALTISESSRVLRPEGLAVLDIPQRGSMGHLVIETAMRLRISRVPLFRFYSERDTWELMREAARQRLRLLGRQPTGYWYALFPFRGISKRLPARTLEELSKLVFRKPLGVLFILSKFSESSMPQVGLDSSLRA